ncbi:superoxide dismutase [Pontibacter sp. G13]|uniref:superoxide dismutase n=1 Tax=Pontibacter sp. G13 TaxID=3074898 RepID=UPI002889CED2|nr:superoxide dismutase [Pontibacter sp. G13]WNJ19213.1 superoxide dismutase [Pontibacter sp. G13]
MDKRTFLKVSALASAGLVSGAIYGCDDQSGSSNGEGSAENANSGNVEAFVLPALPYAYNALEPHIDQMTMEIHHDKHHAGYVKKLNAALADGSYSFESLEGLLASLTDADTAVRNSGGGHWNHSMFWNIMSPKTGQVPEGQLAEAINSAFGDFEAFKTQFGEAAKTRFGSGWAWLSVDSDKKLFVSSTPNQDNPLMTNLVEQAGTPILGIDVWEHAYYLKYQNLRGSYINEFMTIINWEEVAKRFAAAMS